MSDYDDLDLSDAFKELTAPRSTANYAHRAPVVELHSEGRHWPQALASVLAVLVAVAGAGTFLALRNARQNGVATSSAGNPPARYGAAMAYDTTSGVTVMYGGTGASGSALHDTWIWDGSTWSPPAHSGGPGPMFNAHMTDDPADGGVLLVGMPDLAIANGSGSSIIGCAVGGSGSGSANGSSVSASPPSSATGAPGIATGTPPTLPAPSFSPLPSGVPVRPVSPCPSPIPTASVQTWVFNAQGWHRVSGGAGAVVPYASAQLAYDAASGEVLAVAGAYYPCGGPLYGSTQQPMIACMAPGASGTSNGGTRAGTGSATAAPQLCPVKGCGGGAMPCVAGPTAASIYWPCGGGESVSTWVWSGSHWSLRANAFPANKGPEVAVYGDGLAGHATLLTLDPIAPAPCTTVISRCKGSLTSVWMWTGSAWRATQPTNGIVAPDLSGATIVPLSNIVVAVTGSGETWTLSGVTWARDATGSAPTARTGEAVAAGPGNTIVLFGGIGLPSVGSALYGNGGAGSDTWVWLDRAWRHVAGSAPPPPTPCPGAGTNLKGCVEILPAQVPPATGSTAGTAPTPKPSASPSIAPTTP